MLKTDVKVGQLDRRITLKTRTTVQTSTGYARETWTDLATVWAQLVDRGGAEREVSEQEVGVRRVAFIIRYRSDIGAADRIEYDGDIYDITNIEEVGRRRFLKISAEWRA